MASFRLLALAPPIRPTLLPSLAGCNPYCGAYRSALHITNPTLLALIPTLRVLPLRKRAPYSTPYLSSSHSSFLSPLPLPPPGTAVHQVDSRRDRDRDPPRRPPPPKGPLCPPKPWYSPGTKRGTIKTWGTFIGGVYSQLNASNLAVLGVTDPGDVNATGIVQMSFFQ